MTIKEKIDKVNQNHSKLSSGQKLQLGGIKSMFRNIKEEGAMGGESHVQPAGVKQAEVFLDKCLLQIEEC